MNYFSERKENYYTINEDECADSICWNTPIGKPCVLIFHDESTFRCGAKMKKRWHSKDKEPFISKGRGKSQMVSNFLVAYPSGPFFSLTYVESEQCKIKYPLIDNFDRVNYERKSCTGSIQPGRTIISV